MPNRLSTYAVRASLLTVVVAMVGCDRHSPAGPTPTPPTPSSPAPVTAPGIQGVWPRSGPSTGGTLVDINGSRFEAGARVTFDGVETPTYPATPTYPGASRIRLPVPPHPAGKVDVAVINPDGQKAQLSAAFTYEDPAGPVSPGPAPSISSISPSAGITGGGTYVYIKGSGFEAGATLTVGGVAFRSNVWSGDSLLILTLPHAAGPVDVQVTNPDGQSTSRIGGYGFAPPESLDFNGRWEGNAGHHLEHVVTFTIEHDILTSVSCGGANHIFSDSLSTKHGEFAAGNISSSVMSGKFFSSSYGNGSINLPPCTATLWGAWKQ